jgi:brefeldin A-inhibited guanine nucleotide-exchange protein
MQIGDYLGEKDDTCVAVMHAYVDLVDFKSIVGNGNTAFLDALRLFLGRFRIPGESQKIDRMMLKFAQRYCVL